MRLHYFKQGDPAIDRPGLRLAVPWLAAAAQAADRDATLPRQLPAAQWLLARADRADAAVTDWRRWLASGCGLGQRVIDELPAGPCAHAAASGSIPSGTWACARPVHLVTGLDHLQLSPARPVLDEAETGALLADLNRHFAATGLRFHRGTAGDWLLESAYGIRCSTIEPALAEGRNLRGLMPGGPDGGRVRSLWNELQMLLHDHPVNERRAARGAPAVNSLWLWGFGEASPPAARSLPPLHTDDAWLAGLWRAHGAPARPLAEFAGAAGDSRAALLGWSAPPAAGAAECLRAAESGCLAPARAALRVGRAGRVELRTGERTVVVSRAAMLRFWRRARPLAEVLA